MENSNDTIGNGTHNLPVCSAVTQPTAPWCAPHDSVNSINKIGNLCITKCCGIFAQPVKCTTLFLSHNF